MRVSRTDINPTTVRLDIEAGAAELEPIHRHVLTHFASNVKVPGFREGKAPGYVVEKNLNQQAVADEFMKHALNDLYNRAAEQEKLRTLNSPRVRLKKFVPYTQLEFEAEVETIGPLKLPNYKSIKLARPKVSITAADVNDVLKSLQIQLAERTDVDRPVKDGDEVVIDFVGKDKSGQPVPGADGRDYPLILGSRSFIPGFEDNLVGAKAGQSKEFTVTFPKDYGVPSLQSQPVTFKVDVKAARELKEPKLDDSFAKKAGPFKNLAELKADIKKQLAAERQRQAEADYQNQLVKKIIDKTDIELPARLVDEEIERLEAEEKRNLAGRGQTWQEHLKAEGLTEEEHRQRQRPAAAERVKGGLVIGEVAEREGIEVSPQEVDIRLQILKGQYPDEQMQAELDKPEARQDIAARLLTEKTLEKLVSYVSK